MGIMGLGVVVLVSALVTNRAVSASAATRAKEPCYATATGCGGVGGWKFERALMSSTRCPCGVRVV